MPKSPGVHRRVMNINRAHTQRTRTNINPQLTTLKYDYHETNPKMMLNSCSTKSHDSSSSVVEPVVLQNVSRNHLMSHIGDVTTRDRITHMTVLKLLFSKRVYVMKLIFSNMLLIM